MRYVQYSLDSRISYGILGPNNKITALEGDLFGSWTKSVEEVELTDVHLLAPVRPPMIIGIGLNYGGHAKESGQSTPKAPIIFLKASTAVADPGQPIILPRMAPDEVDYEAELVIVIGKEAHNVSEDDALKYVLGFTCGNDVSARDCQLRFDVQWARGKSFDTFAPLGPWIETEIDSSKCSIQSRLNGKIMQSSNTSDLIFNPSQLVSYISKCMTLKPGTVIMTGTPAGVGFARKPPVFLRKGDVVEVEVGSIGTLVNPVQNEV